MSGAESVYSYSYTPSPAPGNEVVDRGNQGFSGETNKWGEATLANPNGTYIVKAKVRVASFTSGKINIKYSLYIIYKVIIVR